MLDTELREVVALSDVLLGLVERLVVVDVCELDAVGVSEVLVRSSDVVTGADETVAGIGVVLMTSDEL